MIYSLFDDYDQPKLSLAVSNMTVTCGYYGPGWNAIGPPYGLPVQHQIVNVTLLGLAAAKVCFRSQRNFGTKNLKRVPLLYYFFHIFSNVTSDYTR